MKRLELFFLSDVKYGGFVSFTAHLIHALGKNDIKARVFKIGKRVENRARVFCSPYHYQNVDIGTAEAVSKPEHSRGLIACCNWKKYEYDARKLLEAGLPIVIHDPTEMHKGLIECIQENDSRVIVIRRTNKAILSEKFGIKSTFIRHPYSRSSTDWDDERSYRAASLSRVDFDKHTEIIIEANKSLSRKAKIHIYGFVNRIYDFHKLSAIDSDWKDCYYGTFPLSIDAGVNLARQFSYIVDMSAIKGDGGGTQYTFFEAWDAGSVLVLNREWITGNSKHNIIEAGVNALVVESAEELVRVMTTKKSVRDKRIIKSGREILKAHSPAKVVGKYQKVLK